MMDFDAEISGVIYTPEWLARWGYDMAPGAYYTIRAHRTGRPSSGVGTAAESPRACIRAIEPVLRDTWGCEKVRWRRIIFPSPHLRVLA